MLLNVSKDNKNWPKSVVLFIETYYFVPGQQFWYLLQALGKIPFSARQSSQKSSTNEMGSESNPVVVTVNNDKRKSVGCNSCTSCRNTCNSDSNSIDDDNNNKNDTQQLHQQRRKQQQRRYVVSGQQQIKPHMNALYNRLYGINVYMKMKWTDLADT